MSEENKTEEDFESYLKEQEVHLEKLKQATSMGKSCSTVYDESQFTTSPLAKYHYRISEYELMDEQNGFYKSNKNHKSRILKQIILLVVFFILISLGIYIIVRNRNNQKNKSK